MPSNENFLNKKKIFTNIFTSVYSPSETLSKRHVAMRKVTEKLDVPLNLGDFGSFWLWSGSTELVPLAEFSSEKCPEMKLFWKTIFFFKNIFKSDNFHFAVVTERLVISGKVTQKVWVTWNLGDFGFEIRGAPPRASDHWRSLDNWKIHVQNLVLGQGRVYRSNITS